MPAVFYVRPSNFLSDSRDKTIITGGSEEEVLQKTYEYLKSPAAQERYIGLREMEITDLENNIRKCIFQKGNKVFSTRAPQEH